jgi:hypothetical protein
LKQLRSIRDEMLMLTVYRVDGENGVFADVGVTVFKAGTAGWDQRFEKLGILGDFLEETKAGSANVFVGVLLQSSYQYDVANGLME